MDKHSIIDRMSPVKQKMEDKIAQAMGVTFGQITNLKFQSLAMFCALCFIKHKNDTIRNQKFAEERGGPGKLVRIEKEEKGFFAV